MKVIKKHIPTSLLAMILMSVAACSTTTHRRAWIGGDYEKVNNQLSATDQPTGLLLKSVYSRTPVDEAGVLPGDVLLQLDDSHIQDKEELLECLDQLTPGQTITLHVLRQMEVMELECILGEEIYATQSFVSFFPISPYIDLWPIDGDFTILGLVGFQSHVERKDLVSPSEIHANRFSSGW